MQANWTPRQKIDWLCERALSEGLRPFEREELFRRANVIYIKELGLTGYITCENEYNGAMKLADARLPVTVVFNRDPRSLEPREYHGPITLIPHSHYEAGGERFHPDKTEWLYKDCRLVGGRITCTPALKLSIGEGI